MRTRLHRMLLSIQRLVASEYGLEIVAPCHLDASRSRSAAYRELATLTTTIMQDSKHLSQRSAALDGRWADEWNSLSQKLDQLEVLLAHPAT